jgi:hypothetical protein
MKGMKQEWKKELREIAAEVRALSREERRDDAELQKRIRTELLTFKRLSLGRERQAERLGKRQAILHGRLAS